tara:strand:+ start:1847 stop:2206 length:360 start_codon:yes stop_codon:yes gene_type:complete
MCEEDNDNNVKIKIKWMNNSWPYEARGIVNDQPFSFKADIETWNMSILKSQAFPNPSYAENIGWHYWGETGDCGALDRSFLKKSNIRRLIREIASVWNKEDRHSLFRCKYLSLMGEPQY